jgi:hypothetical protein
VIGQPIVRSLLSWGDAFSSPAGVKRALRHDQDGGLLDDGDAVSSAVRSFRSRRLESNPAPVSSRATTSWTCAVRGGPAVASHTGHSPACSLARRVP